MSASGPNKYFKSASDIRPIVGARGYCLGSKRITVDGTRVGYLYRETPDSPGDSGWGFMAGDESPEYSKDAGNFEIYDVNTIANYDEEIIQFLDHPVGCEYVRTESGGWRALKTPGGATIDIVTMPDVHGHVVVAESWSLELPDRFSRRLEGAGIEVLWREGLTLFFGASRNRDPEKAFRGMLAGRPPNATHFADEHAHGLRRISYCVPQTEDGRVVPLMMGIASFGDDLLVLEAKFDEELTLATVRSIWNSLLRELREEAEAEG